MKTDVTLRLQPAQTIKLYCRYKYEYVWNNPPPHQRNSPLFNNKYIKITIYGSSVKKVALVRVPRFLS